MHVLIYSNWYLTLVTQAANALAAKHRVTLVFPDQSPELKAFDGRTAELHRLLDPRIELITLKHMQYFDPLGWIPVLKTWRLIRRLRPDIVHFNESYDFRCLLLLLLCRTLPYVTTVHDPVPHSDEKISLQKFKHWVRDQIRQKSQGLVVYGESLKRTLADYSGIPTERIYCVPHGEYTYFEKFSQQQDAGKLDDYQYLLFFGRWEYYKGIDILVDAEPLITAKHPHVKIILAGEGRLPLSDLEPHMVHPENFIIKNYNVPDNEVPELFQRADIVVLPYREASQSGPLHIAATFAKPSIVTRVGAMPEVVQEGETGLLIKPEDAQALADAVCYLLDHPEEAKWMGEHAQQHSQATESLDKVAEIQAAVYHQVITDYRKGHQGIIMRLLQKVVKKLKRDPDYALDECLRPGDVIAMMTKLGMGMLRGMYHRLFLGECRGLCFIGKRVKLRNRKHIFTGRNFIAEDDCEIQGLSKVGIHFGDNVTVGSCSMIRPSGYYGREIGEGLVVGDRSNIGPYCYLGASGGIEIGSEVMMGPRVSLFAENHNFERTDVSMRSQGVTRQKIIVEDDCWLASGSIILAGVTIGRGSIVAAGAVVTRDVPPYSIAGGSPARILKQRKRDQAASDEELTQVEAEIQRLAVVEE